MCYIIQFAGVVRALRVVLVDRRREARAAGLKAPPSLLNTGTEPGLSVERTKDMNMTTQLPGCRRAAGLLVLSLGLYLPGVSAQTTAFTYQGRLLDGGAPANGSYDLLIGLCTSAGGGSPVAGPLAFPATPASNGLFTVTLDFGGAWFDGGARWLEISMRPTGALNYTTLAPRQSLSSAPYAIRAANAGLATSVPAGAISSAMLADGAVTGPKLAPGAVSQLGAPGGTLTNAVYVNTDGSVGIGTNTTGAALQIAGGALYTNSSGARFAGVIVNHSAGVTNLATPIRMSISGNRAYVSSFNPGSLEIFDIPNPGAPAFLGEAVDRTANPSSPFTLLTEASGVFVTNGIAYVTSENKNSVTVMDVSNPQNPLLLSTLVKGSGGVKGLDLPTDVIVSGTNCFVLGFFSASISVFDVHDPVHPALVTEVFDTNRLNFAYHMSLAGGKLFIAARAVNSVTIYDVSNPANPQFAGQLADRTVSPSSPFTRLVNANWVEVVGNTAYITAGPWSGVSSSLTIADVSNPAAPIKLSEIADVSVVPGSPFGLLRAAWAVKVVGQTAFVTSAFSGGLTAVDVSDPRNPRLLAQWANGTNGLTSLGITSGMAVAGNILYVLDEGIGAINLFDLRSPLGLDVGGFVGIGTATPRTALDVAGTVTAQGLDVNGPVQSAGAGTFGTVFAQGSLTVDAANANNGTTGPGLVFGGSGTEGIASKRTPGGNQNGLDFFVGNVSRMSITTNGFVGIGTNLPSAPLYVQGDGTNGAGTLVGVQTSGSGFSGGVYGLSLVPGGNGVYGEANVLATGIAGPGVANIGVLGRSGATNGTGVNGFALASTGVTYGVYGEVASPQGYGGYFQGRGYFSGNLGVGTASPQAELQVEGGSNLAAFVDSSSGIGTWLTLGNTAGGSQWSLISTATNNGEGANKLLFSAGSSLGTASPATMTLQNGAVGIGTSSPGAALDVRGDVRMGASGQYLAAGSTQNLRIVRGIIEPDGTVFPGGTTNGNGFFISRSGTGTYAITFNPAFADVPALTITPYSANAPVTANCNSGSPSGYSTVVTWVGTAKADSWWNFIAIGGR